MQHAQSIDFAPNNERHIDTFYYVTDSRLLFPRQQISSECVDLAQCSRPRTQAQVLSKKKRSSQKFFRRSPQKNVFQVILQALHKILTIQKIMLSSSRGQANFRELEAKDFKMCPQGQGRPRGLNLCKECPLIKRDYRYRNIRIILGLPITDQWLSG